MANLKQLSFGITLLIVLVVFTSYIANTYLIELQKSEKHLINLGKKHRKNLVNGLELSINFVVFLFFCISIITYFYTSKIATILAEVENINS